jgi:hypothetical protein
MLLADGCVHPGGGAQSLSLLKSELAGQQPSPFTLSAIVVIEQTTLQPEPDSLPTEQPFDAQLVGQSPSHCSPFSLTPLPQTGAQSESLLALAAFGQQPSPLLAVVIAAAPHATLHICGEPWSLPGWQASTAGHDVLQLPSQISPESITPLPHETGQSLSLPEFAPVGQHWSPLAAFVIGVWLQTASQVATAPLNVSTVHGSLSSQAVTQSPSQSSSGSL